MIENDLSEQDLGLTFSVEREAFGAYEEVELKPGGQDVPVTQDNKREYVDLLAEWRLKGTRARDMTATPGASRPVGFVGKYAGHASCGGSALVAARRHCSTIAEPFRRHSVPYLARSGR